MTFDSMSVRARLVVGFGSLLAVLVLVTCIAVLHVQSIKQAPVATIQPLNVAIQAIETQAVATAKAVIARASAGELRNLTQRNADAAHAIPSLIGAFRWACGRPARPGRRVAL